MSYLRMEFRGGVRGGKDQFEWEDVKVDKHRENYLGHSLKAPVGRWQKGKDLTWYTKESKVAGRSEKLQAEIAAVKKAEEEAMAAALGLKSFSPAQPQATLTKQEIAEVCRRRTSETAEETGEEVMKGVGYQSRRSQMLFSGSESTTTREGMTVFEHDPSGTKDDGRLTMAPPPKVAKREEETRKKSKHKKRHKKDKKPSKHSSGTEERERKRKSHKHRRHDSDSD